MMKRIRFIALSTLILFLFSGCTNIFADDCFGHEVYTNVDDYNKISKLSEIRCRDYAFELFPERVDNLDVTDFYFEWELGAVGGSKTEFLLSVDYEKDSFNDEISRLKSLGNGKIIYDTESFKYPAYVSLLGHNNTNYYALVDEMNHSVSYILLQLISVEDIDINKEFLPDDYGDFGEVEGVSYNIYE